ncbi:hypothetical protein H0H87_001598 [Tephrocybe sp. NHM501043]|nr:hypothetical protein H0H87_001598 [Tephrocybe sp. NHM501043]
MTDHQLSGSLMADSATISTSPAAKDLGFIPIPKRLWYNPDKPIRFGLGLNVAFGYATGLLLISPLGDLVRRRQLLLCLTVLSTSLTIGLAVTSNLIAFETLSFLVGMVSVAPQILLPLAADLAPPERRASAMSVVLSGLLFGILVARVLAGVIAEFTTWRVVYYMAIGTQSVVLLGMYLMLPDYPAKNDDLTYWDILWTMAKFAVTEPLLIQGSLINLASSACFSNFWVTLTFLLGGPPYNYSTYAAVHFVHMPLLTHLNSRLVIGLFGLVGMFGVAMGPFVGILIDKLIPWYASLISIVCLLCFQSVQTAAGGVNIAAVIIATLGLDVFRQMLQVSLSTAVFEYESSLLQICTHGDTRFRISVAARSRLNAIMILSVRCLA